MSRRRLGAGLAAAAGTAAVLTSAFLIGGQVAAMRRAPAEAARLEALEERVRTDPEAAVELEAERERQTVRSVAREARNRRLGYGLLAAVAAFLAAENWRRASAASPRKSPLTPLSQRGEPEGRPSASPSFRKGGGRGEDFRAQRGPLFSLDDVDAVDAVVAREGRGRESAIPILQALQRHYRYLPEAALRRVCELTEITPAQLAGVASFYAQFRRTLMGDHRVRLCHGTACHVAGVGPIRDELVRRLAIPPGDDTDPERRFTLDPVACLGCCSLAPVMMVDDDVAGRLTPSTAYELLVAGKESR
jgi:NADH:ubiquinone oxidoreductase subunit E